MATSSPYIRPQISVPATLFKIQKHYHPVMIGLLNNETEFRLAKIKGEFIWHAHPETDELFYILEGGPLTLKYRAAGAKSDSDGSETGEQKVVLEKGDLFVVPQGVEHLPSSEEEVSVLFVERKGTLNTGDRGVGERTVTIPDVRS